MSTETTRQWLPVQGAPIIDTIASDFMNAGTKGSHFIPSQCLSTWILNIRLGINDTGAGGDF